MQPKNFERDYDHHPPRTQEQGDQHEQVRAAMRSHAQFLDTLVPPGRERSVMHTKLEEAMFWANAGLARGRYDEQEADTQPA